MKKVLILYNRLWHYRIPIFQIVGMKYDLTVAFVDGPDVPSLNFHTMKLDVYKLGNFVYHQIDLFGLCQNYDVIINGFDLHYIKQQSLLLHKNRRFKIINYGINVRAAYNHQYGKATYVDLIRFYLAKKADALLFYSTEPFNRYINAGFNKERLFAANNTVLVLPIELNSSDRDSILFVGTLYREKGIDVLLNSYKKLLKDFNNPPQLVIVGGGPGLADVKKWIKENRLDTFIIAKGPIYDETELMELHKKAIVSVSPNQAGLSVLKSFGYGVPFITSENAITGGEIFNIDNGKTGYLYKTDSEFLDILKRVFIEKAHFIEMGKNAFQYYYKHRKIEDMAQGFIDAIDYVLSKKI